MKKFWLFGVLFHFLLFSAASSQELGSISREVPNQICVYDVKLKNDVSLKKGDIVQIHHKDGVGEATVMEVAPSKIVVSLKGVYDVQVGNRVEFARSTSDAGSPYGPIPVPRSFTLYESQRGGFRIGVPPGMTRTEGSSNPHWTSDDYLLLLGSDGPEDGKYRDIEKQLEGWAKKKNGIRRLERGSVTYGGETFKVLTYYETQGRQSSIRRSIFIEPSRSFRIEGQFPTGRSKTIETAMKTFRPLD